MRHIFSTDICATSEHGWTCCRNAQFGCCCGTDLANAISYSQRLIAATCTRAVSTSVAFWHMSDWVVHLQDSLRACLPCRHGLLMTGIAHERSRSTWQITAKSYFSSSASVPTSCPKTPDAASWSWRLDGASAFSLQGFRPSTWRRPGRWGVGK